MDLNILKDKSGFNLDAAEILIENDLYASSVHCSYFAALQFLKYKLSLLSGVSITDLEDSIHKTKHSSHKYIIDNTLNQLLKSGWTRREHQNLQQKILDLKLYRIRADYQAVTIYSTDSDKCLTFSKEIINQLKKTK